jgi:hypothetical protein
MASKSFLFATNASNNDTLLQLIIKSVPNMLQMLSYNLQKYDTNTSVQHQVCYNYVSSVAEPQQLQNWTKPALQTFTWHLNSCKYTATALKNINCFTYASTDLRNLQQFAKNTSIQHPVQHQVCLLSKYTSNKKCKPSACFLQFAWYLQKH